MTDAAIDRVLAELQGHLKLTNDAKAAVKKHTETWNFMHGQAVGLDWAIATIERERAREQGEEPTT
jgi:hypothetical protein